MDEFKKTVESEVQNSNFYLNKKTKELENLELKVKETQDKLLKNNMIENNFVNLNAKIQEFSNENKELKDKIKEILKNHEILLKKNED